MILGLWMRLVPKENRRIYELQVWLSKFNVGSHPVIGGFRIDSVRLRERVFRFLVIKQVLAKETRHSVFRFGLAFSWKALVL